MGGLFFTILSYGPYFVVTVILVEMEDVLGASSRMLASDLNHLGQNCVCIM